MASLIRGLYEDWCHLDERVATFTGEIEKLSPLSSVGIAGLGILGEVTLSPKPRYRLSKRLLRRVHPAAVAAPLAGAIPKIRIRCDPMRY